MSIPMTTIGYDASSGVSSRRRMEKAKARDHGCYFCVDCDQPIRGTVCYLDGAACHYGCGARHGDPNVLESLEPCQELALKNVRKVTKTLHDAAVPRLRERMHRSGFAPDAVDAMLAWIRDQAPIIIPVDLEAMGAQLAAGTHYRNQFETDASRGALSHEALMSWEASLFDNAYVDAPPAHRCKYGVLNVTNNPQAVHSCSNYGTIYLLLRHVRLRTTFAARDSGATHIEDLATVDYHAHVLETYSDEQLRALVEVSTGRVFGRDFQVITNCKEAQIHGEVSLAENVEAIMAHPYLLEPKHHDVTQQFARRCNAPIIWMEGGAARAAEPHSGTHHCDETVDVTRHTEASRSLSHGMHDGDDDDVVRASEAFRGLSHCSHENAEDDAIRRATPASHELVETEMALAKMLADEEATELEQALELSRFESQAALTNVTCEAPKTDGMCANGCGRHCAEGYPTCCRTCGATGGTSHGSVCEQEKDLAEAIRRSEIDIILCVNGCGRQAVTSNVLCRICLEEDEVARAIQASQEAETCELGTQKPTWACPLCTLVNEVADASCKVCEAPRSQAIEHDVEASTVEQPGKFAEAANVEVPDRAMAEARVLEEAPKVSEEFKLKDAVNAEEAATVEPVAKAREEAGMVDESANSTEEARNAKETPSAKEAAMAEAAQAAEEARKLEEAAIAEEVTHAKAATRADDGASMVEAAATCTEEAANTEATAKTEEEAGVEAAEETRAMQGQTAHGIESEAQKNPTNAAMQAMQEQISQLTLQLREEESYARQEKMRELEAAKTELAARVEHLEAKLAQTMKKSAPACEEASEDLQMVQTIKASMGQDTRRTQFTYSTDAAGDEVLAAITDAVKFIFTLPRIDSLVLQYKDPQDGEMMTLDETTVRDFLESPHGGTRRLFVKTVENCKFETAPAQALESNSEHFIGHDDDLNHVDDPLADWYVNPCGVDARVDAAECFEFADVFDQ